MPRKAPKTGHPILDNLLLTAWAMLAGMNQWISLGEFADLMVGVGALLTALLTALRIYQHLKGETILATVMEDDT